MYLLAKARSPLFKHQRSSIYTSLLNTIVNSSKDSGPEPLQRKSV